MPHNLTLKLKRFKRNYPYYDTKTCINTHPDFKHLTADGKACAINWLMAKHQSSWSHLIKQGCLEQWQKLNHAHQGMAQPCMGEVATVSGRSDYHIAYMASAMQTLAHYDAQFPPKQLTKVMITKIFVMHSNVTNTPTAYHKETPPTSKHYSMQKRLIGCSKWLISSFNPA